MKNFRDLAVWKKAHHLALAAYKATAGFPAEERFSLTSQIRRAASSIPANLAEACGRDGDGEFFRFLQIAMGSASEVEYHFLLARDLGYLNPSLYGELNDAIGEIKRMLSSLIKKVREDRRSG